MIAQFVGAVSRPFRLPPGGATVLCNLSRSEIAPSDRGLARLNSARTARASSERNSCCWPQAQVPERADLRPVLALKPTSAPAAADPTLVYEDTPWVE